MINSRSRLSRLEHGAGSGSGSFPEHFVVAIARGRTADFAYGFC